MLECNSTTEGHPFFGYLALTLEPVERKDLKPPTMATDGLHLFYHPDFLKSVTIPQIQGVIAHEIMHIILKHLPRAQGREPKRWNVACDYVANPLVLKEFQLPAGCLNDARFYDKTAEYVYSNLPMSKDPSEGTLDSHEEWKNWGQDKKGGSGGSGQDKDGVPSASDEIPDIEQEWEQRVATAATQARVKGKFPAHLESIVGELLQPKLDWKALLRDRITSCAKNDYRIFPVNKRYIHTGLILPGISGESINVAACIDTSGSISDDDVRIFLSEVKGICDQYDEYTIYLYYADAAVQDKFEIHSFDPLPMVIHGRGGTDFRPAIEEACTKDVTSIIYFTDLYGTFPDKEPNIPLIWVCTSDQKPPWGSLIPYPMETPSRRRR